MERPAPLSYEEILRIIDLVSGECVVNERIAVTRYSSEAMPVDLAYYVDDRPDIPGVFIFDYEGGELVQVDLEIVE